MGKINGCLKSLFIFFNVIYLIQGCVLVYGAIKATGYSNQISMAGGLRLAWGWVFAIGVLGISCLGIYAGTSEKGLPLKIFAGFMVAGMVIMMIFGIIVVVERNKLKEQLDGASSGLAKKLIMENDEMRARLENLQRTAKCCGVWSYEDWGDNIPSSCSCSSGYRLYEYLGSECKARPQGTSGPDQIYRQTCGELIFPYVDRIFQIAMSFCFGLAVTALFGLLISILMVHQIRRHDYDAAFPIAMKGF